MSHLLFASYQKLEQIFAWPPFCYSAFHQNVASKKVPHFSRVYHNTSLQDLRSKLHTLFASLHDCHTVIIGIRKLNNNIQVFSSGMMFFVLIKTGQVFQKLKVGDRYDDLKRSTFFHLGRKVGKNGKQTQ
jgi:hypothetical protein